MGAFSVPRKRGPPGVVAALAALACAPVCGQEKTSALTDLSLEQLANIEVTSVSRRAERLADAPASIYVITGDDIRRSGVTSLPFWSARAQDAGSLEHQVKAAFLYKFAGFVDWPSAAFARPDTPLTIAVAGSDAVAAELVQATTGRTVEGRTVTVKRLKGGESLAGVHILFVGKADNARLNQWVQGARPHSVLTVSESDGALAQGSVINFVIADRRVRFEVALDSAEKSKLKLSSRLLAVAQQVYPTGTP